MMAKDKTQNIERLQPNFNYEFGKPASTTLVKIIPYDNYDNDDYKKRIEAYNQDEYLSFAASSLKTSEITELKKEQK